MMIVVMRRGTMPGRATATGHSHAALGAQLPALRLHASRGPGYIGNGVATEPHRIGRAGLPNVDLA